MRSQYWKNKSFMDLSFPGFLVTVAKFSYYILMTLICDKVDKRYYFILVFGFGFCYFGLGLGIGGFYGFP